MQVMRRSEKRHELVHRYFYSTDNCPKSATVKRRMHRNGYRVATLADQADVTTLLSHLPVTEFSECFDTVVSRHSGHVLWKISGTDRRIEESPIT
jgi:hypothetical protein